MPKIYSANEKKEIIRKLKQAAAESLKNNGVKKTTVDNLVKKAGIPKGTFYLFYKSKELLLFDVISDIHTQVETSMKESFVNFGTEFTPDTMTELILKYYVFVSESCLFSLMMGGELEYLISKLPDATVAEHLLHDDNHAMDILKMLPPKEGLNVEALSGAFRSIFLALPYKREIGEEHFYDSIRMLIYGLVIQMF